MQKIRLYAYITLAMLLIGCTKEVEIDIAGFEEQLVVEGRIETNGFPIVLLSRSQNVYAATNIGSYLQSFISDATISVNNGQQKIELELFSITELPLPSQKTVAEMLELELYEVVFLPILVYSTSNTLIKGEKGKTYALDINYKGKSYNGSTSLLNPVPLDTIYWMPNSENTEYGLSVGRLSDPKYEYNAYKWEAKRINIQSNGEELDTLFRKGGSAYFDDKFFNGITLEFEASNRQRRKDPTHLLEYKRYYRLGDSVVVKFSRIDEKSFDFYNKMDAQLNSAGNPFATPVNIPSNISGGALGIWCGVSPWYDTLYCIP